MKKSGNLLLFLLVVLLFASIMPGGCAPPPDNNSGKMEENQEEAGRQEESQEEDGKQEDPGIEAAIEKEHEKPLAITYLGHATFFVQHEDTDILIDPYQPDFGHYGRIDLQTDAVLISHEHTDHNYAPGGGQGSTILRGLTADGDWLKLDFQLADVQITSITGTLHGQNLGKNSIFTLATPDLRLVYLGDIGHTLQAEEIAQIGRPDVLFVPVGGHYTIPPREALALIAQLSPAIVIPMHYKTAHNPETPIGTLEDFLELDIPYPVKPRGSRLELTGEIIPAQTEIWTMEYVLP